MPAPISYNATLVGRHDLTSTLAIFTVRPDEPLKGAPPFVPGQYMTIGLNNEERPELGSVRRPMSIASAPEERETVDFFIRLVPNTKSTNPLTPLLFKSRVSDRIFLRTRPAGKFTIPDTVGEDPRYRVFVAAGTGLAPFISMLRHDQRRGTESALGRTAVVHGVSYPSDLGYRGELVRLSEGQGLRYLATVSRPNEAPEWNGDSGRVEDYFLPNRIEETDERLGLGAGGLTPERAVVFICGLQGTIGMILSRLTMRGFVPDVRRIRRALEVPEGVPSSLFYEQYDTRPVIDLDDPQAMDPLREQMHSALGAVRGGVR